MTNTWEDFLYKKVSLYTGILALVGTIATATFFMAGIKTELALVNQKIENHIVHISNSIEKIEVDVDKNKEHIGQIREDISAIKAILKK